MEKGATWETSVILILLLCLTAACIGLACHMVSYREPQAVDVPYRTVQAQEDEAADYVTRPVYLLN